MTFQTGSSLGIKVCEALGIDPRCVRKITIALEAGDVATVRIDRYLLGEEAKAILSELELFKVSDPEVIKLDQIEVTTAKLREKS